MKGALNMDTENMTCEELKAEIIRMVKEIDDIEILEKIYHFVKKLLIMERKIKIWRRED